MILNGFYKGAVLTIHTQNIYSPEDNLSVYLPVRCYELTLKHRLLDQLGGFSYLIMDVLTFFPEQGINLVLEITGLNLQQLEPVLKRLNQLDIVKSGQLSPRGIKLSNYKRMLHEQTRKIWLDGDYQSHMFFGNSSLDTTELQDSTAFIIRRWQKNESDTRLWPCFDWNEDCTRQQNRILKNPDLYFSPLFENYNECFVKDGFPSQEWELTVRVASNNSTQMIEVKIDVCDLCPKANSEYTVSSPVLCLQSYYNMPVEAPNHLKRLLPSTHCQTISLVNIDNLSHLVKQPSTTWVWPSISSNKRTELIELLYKNITIPVNQSEQLFNREHRIEERWQHLSFEWTHVTRQLQTKGLHFIGYKE